MCCPTFSSEVALTYNGVKLGMTELATHTTNGRGYTNMKRTIFLSIL